MEEVRKKILVKAIQLYARYGIKSLTMDDIAREMGISKKTLYQYVNDKEDLVNQAFRYHLNQEEQNCHTVFNGIKNPIEEMLAICVWQSENIGKINPAAFYDLKKYHPNSFNEFALFKKRFILPMIISNLKRGMEQEIYRSDLNVDSIAQIYLHLIDFSSHPDLTGFSSIGNIIHEIITYHLHSITSLKGRKLLTKELEKLHI